jgi:uncharacterized membrane protein (UPF0182 family)
VREISTPNLNSQTWVNSHLVFTHGYGMVMAPANSESTSEDFAMQNVPVTSSSAAPTLSQPQVYYGLGETGYVVVDSSQSEYDYQTGAKTVYQKYSGTGGIRIGGFWQKAAFALRFHDFNLLVSKDVTPTSRIMFNQDVRSIVQNVAPFLTVDSNPYPVVVNGGIDWVVDAYTTSSWYPYSQPVNTSALPPGSGLAGSYNYLRNSVKAVVNAYTGRVTLYTTTNTDPVLNAWERAFPGVFQPMSSMPSTLQQHLRYPQDFLTVEASMFGKYHVPSTQSGAQEFYGQDVAWSVATNSAGQTSYVSPTYQLLSLPGATSTTPTLNAYLPLVPLGGRAQNLTSFLVASCSFSNYGQLTAYEVPQESSLVDGPALANSTIASYSPVSIRITQLDQHGSRVLSGPTLLVPIDNSLLYVKAFFDTSAANSLPQLAFVTAVYNSKAYMASTFTGPTGVLAQVFGAPAGQIGSTQPVVSLNVLIESEIAQVSIDENAASAAAKEGDWAKYGTETANVQNLLAMINKQIKQLEHTKGSSGGTSTTTTTLPSQSGSSTTTTTVPTNGTSSTTSTTSPSRTGSTSTTVGR